MAVHNTDVAEIFREMADLLELEDADEFRVRAYRQAATTIDELGRSVGDMIDDGDDLTKLPGIGKDLAGKIEEIVEKGQLKELEELRKQTVPSLRELTHIPQVGPKRARALHEQLGIKTLDDLEEAARSHRIQEISGFGKRAEERILDAIETGRKKKERRLLVTVEEAAQSLDAFINSLDGVKDACVAGSYRRRKETVGDLDAVASSDSPGKVIEQFVEYEDVKEVISKGTARSSILLRSGLQVDLRVVKPESYGAALIYFTGAKEHQLRLRDMAIDRDQKLNEYGLFDKHDKQLAGKTEEGIYAAFRLAYVEPELRENRGEIDIASKKNKLPKLITIDDIRGDLHCHTDWSDGRASIREMASAAIELGHDYLAITDHSQRMRMVNGLNAKELRRQVDEVRKIDDDLDGLTLLTGIEVDILDDGSLDLPDDVLSEVDVVICSIHSAMDLSMKKQTDRLLRAIENPCCQIIGHPTGRRVLERDPIDLDRERVFKEAKDAGCILEINADPHRLDLDDNSTRIAKEIGVRFAISTDAHSVAGLKQLKYGVDVARRGWLEREDVINTKSLTNLRKALRSK